MKFFTCPKIHTVLQSGEKKSYTHNEKWSASKITSLNSLVALSLLFATFSRKKNPLKSTSHLRSNANYTIAYIVQLIQNFSLIRRQRIPPYFPKIWKGQIHNFMLIYEWMIDRHPHTYRYMQYTGSWTNIFIEFDVQKGQLFSTDLIL